MQTIFAGKRIVVGITGSIAAFKVAGWVSELAKEEALVDVVMTDAARRFITPLTFSALTGNDVYTDMFADGAGEVMAHINLGRDAEVFLIAPATANCIAKLACGLADDLLTTTVLACRRKVIICPAMNSHMYAHPATRNNMARLRQLGYLVIDPDSGMMACKEEGHGRLPEWGKIREHLAKALTAQDLAGRKILVTAGPTREAIDPARFISNRSSGKMGYALATAAFRRGAEVLLVSGPSALACPEGVQRIVVESARDMYDAVTANAGECAVIIKAAAVADYRPEKRFDQKIKKDQIEKNLALTNNPDILMELGKRKKAGQILVGFAAESQNLKQEGMKKLKAKNLDFIAVNNINSSNTGFETENNQVLLLSLLGEEVLPHTTKLHTADLILDRVCARLNAADS